MNNMPWLTKDRLDELITIERTLWQNNPDVYHDRYLPEAVLVFTGVGRLDRDTAVAAIRKENADGRAWAEVRFDDVDGRWISGGEAGLITYIATARWNYESAVSETLCATLYIRAGESWKVAFHQQTPM